MTCLFFFLERGKGGVRGEIKFCCYFILNLIQKMYPQKHNYMKTQHCVLPLTGICDLHKIRCEKFQAPNVCQLFLSEHTLYTEAKNSRTNKCATANISDFIRMIMAHGWLAPPATVSTVWWKCGTRWWNVLPSLVCIIRTKNSILIHFEIFGTQKMIGWGGTLLQF